MPKALFAAEQVFQAADALLAEGKEVSALNLLSRLGGGSLTTIYKHLFAWQEARKQERAIGTVDIPEPVQNAFMSAMTGIWRVAATEAAREVHEAKEKAKGEVQNLQIQFEGALRAIEKLEQETDSQDAQIESFTAKITELEINARRIENECAAQTAAADQLRRQVGSLEAELTRVHSEAEKHRLEMQAELEKLRTEKDTAMNAVAEVNGQLKTAREQHSELVAKVGKHLTAK